MTSLTVMYLDFVSSHSYRAWRWLSLLPERGEVEIRPYSPDLEAGRPCSPWDRTSVSWGLELLALAEFARDSDEDVHRAFCAATFAGLHQRSEGLHQLEAWLALGAGVGLDLDAYSADCERWRAEVGLWHVEAEDTYGVSEVPSLVFSEGHPLVLRLDEEVAGPGEARQLLDDLLDLAVGPVAAVHRAVPQAR